MSCKNILLSVFVSSALFGSCIPSNTFEKNIAISHHQWHADDIKKIDFTISDTNSHYLMYAMIRHTDAYHFSNIWLEIETIKPDSTSTKQRIELPLAEVSGQWAGRGMDEIYEHKIRLSGNTSTKFDQTGDYIIKLKQLMRENPLQEMLSVGIRIERIPSQ